MITIEAKPGAALRLGYTGEHLARRIKFDVCDWRELYGEGTVVLLALREGDAAPYAVPIEQNNCSVIWNLRREDVAIAGGGECELQYLVGDVVVKEERWITTVEPSLDEPGEYPEAPERGYLEQVAAEGAAARTAAREARYRAEAAANSAKRAEAALDEILNHDPDTPDVPAVDEEKVREIVRTELPDALPSSLRTDDTLVFTNGVLRVNTALSVEQDNTRPVTSAAVYTVVGNIDALLDAI